MLMKCTCERQPNHQRPSPDKASQLLLKGRKQADHDCYTWVQDALERLGQMDEELRSRIRIQYVDSYGEVEAGVDGGGLFKDFMENLIKEGFNPEIGLFRTTPEQKLYPNPAASSAVPNALALFEFLGKMLGKAMYEVGILLGTHVDFTCAFNHAPPCSCLRIVEHALQL